MLYNLRCRKGKLYNSNNKIIVSKMQGLNIDFWNFLMCGYCIQMNFKVLNKNLNFNLLIIMMLFLIQVNMLFDVC